MGAGREQIACAEGNSYRAFGINFMPWVILAILATLIWTFVAVLDKFIISRELRDPILASVTFGTSVFIFFGFVSLLFGNILLPLSTIFIAIIAGIMYVIAVWLFYFSLSKGEVSRFIPVLSTIPIFVLLFAFLFLGEVFTALTYFGVILIVVGAVLIYVKKSTHKIGIDVIFLIVIGAAMFYALRNVILKFAVSQASIWSIFFWVGIGSGLVSLFLFAMHHPHIRRKARLGVKHMLFSGILAAVALLLFTLALSIGPVSLVSALVAIEPLFVFLLATFLSIFHPKFIREKITKSIIMQKLVAIILIIIGAVLII